MIQKAQNHGGRLIRNIKKLTERCRLRFAPVVCLVTLSLVVVFIWFYRCYACTVVYCMKHREMEISFMLIVISVVVWFGRTLQVSASFSSIIVMKVEWTLTHDTLLSYLTAASRPDLQTLLRIRSLGCGACRRGRHGGQLKLKSALMVIPVVIGRRVTHGQPKSTDVVSHRRQRYLRNIGLPRSDQR